MSKSFEGIAIGDFHLDKLGKYFENHLELQINEVTKGFEYALRHGIEHVILLGDIADRDRLSEPAKLALFELLYKYDNKLTIHVILGNHDVRNVNIHSLEFFSKLCTTGLFKTITIYDSPTQVSIGGINVNFLPFPCIQRIDSDVPCLNFAHLDRPGTKGDNGRISTGGTPQEDDDTWIIGHLHTAQQLGKTHFSGTMYQTNFGESQDKYFIKFKVRMKDGRLKRKVELIETFPEFKLINLVVDKKSVLKTITDNPLHLYKLFVKKGVELPKDLNKTYPNIVNSVGYEKKAELDTFLSIEETVSINITSGLKEYLTDKGASDWELKRAKQLITELKSQI